MKKGKMQLTTNRALLWWCAALLLLAFTALAIISEESTAEYDINCRLKGHLDTEKTSHNVAVRGDYAYVADGGNGLRIVDISDPANPWEKGHFDTGGGASDVAVSGDYAYMAWGTSGLVIVDISDLSNPSEEGRYNTQGEASSLTVSGKYAYLANTDNGLFIFDISDQSEPVVEGKYNSKYAMDVVVSGDFAYLADYDYGFVIVDISDKSDPQKVGRCDTDDHAWGVALSGDYAYVADREDGLVIIDIANKEAPSIIKKINTPGHALDVVLDGNYAYVADGSKGILMIDISDNYNPVKEGHFLSSYAVGIAMSGNHIYVADYDNGLVIVEKAPVAWIDDISPNPAGDTDDVHFVGHGTDDGSISRYAWRSSIDDEIYDGTQGEFDSSPLTPGDHTIYFKVRDNHGVWSDEAETTLSVRGKMEAYIDTISPNPALDTDNIYFEGHGTDEESVRQYAWRSDASGEIYNGTEAGFYNDALGIGEYDIYFKVMDDTGAWSDEDSIPLTIHERPVAQIDFISPNPALDTETVSFEGHGTDDGFIVQYAWRSDVSGEIYNGTDPIFHNDTLAPAVHTIYFRVRDNHGAWSHEDNTTLIIHEKPVAFIDSIPSEPVLDTDDIHFGGYGTDDGNITRYAWRSSIDGEFFNDTATGGGTREGSGGDYKECSGEGSSEGTREGSLEYSVEFYRDDLSLGNHTIYFRVMDNYEAWSDEVSEAIIIHSRPVVNFSSMPPKSRIRGESINFTANGTDDGMILLYVWNSSIDGEIYNGTDAGFYFSNLSLGTHNITLRVMDNYGVWSDEVLTTVKVKEEDEVFFLLQMIGPLPVYGYIGMAILAVGALVGVARGRKSKKSQVSSFPEQITSTIEQSQNPVQGSIVPIPPPQLTLQQSIPATGPQPLFQQQVQAVQAQSQIPQFQPVQPQQTFPQAGLVPPQQAPQQTFPQQPIPQTSQPVPGVAQQRGTEFRGAVERRALDKQAASQTTGAWQCPKCGSTMDGNYRFCTGCGTSRSV